MMKIISKSPFDTKPKKVIKKKPKKVYITQDEFDLLLAIHEDGLKF